DCTPAPWRLDSPRTKSSPTSWRKPTARWWTTVSSRSSSTATGSLHTRARTRSPPVRSRSTGRTPDMWSWDAFLTYLTAETLLQGAVTTIWLTVVTMLLGLILGLVLAIARG